MIRQNTCQPRAPSVLAACSWSMPSSSSTGSTSRTTNGSETKIVASIMPGTEKITDGRAEPAVLAPDEDQREADDHRRHREREVDQHVEQALAAEVVAGEHPRGQHAEDRVQRHGDQRDHDREVERVLGRRRRDGVPGGGRSPSRTRGRRPCRPGPRAARRGSRARRCGARSGSSRHPPAGDERDRRAAPGTRSPAAARDTAAAPVVLSLSIWPNTSTEATSVLYGRLPLISTTEPNSPTRAAEREPDAASIAGAQRRQDDPAEDRPRPRAERLGGLLDLALELHQHRLHRAHDERQRHEQQRQQRSPTRV